MELIFDEMMNVRINPSWLPYLQPEFDKPYFAELTDFVRQQYNTRTVYPPRGSIFRAFDACPFDRVRVVIIGQDPYHGPGQANGLCFSVADRVPHPPSLRNILTEVQNDVHSPYPQSGDLGRWAEQGVLMLNAVLTVEAHQAASHQGRGWERFTDSVVQALTEHREGVVYMLWGSYAQRKGVMVDRGRNLVLESVHPSPLSAYRGFFGSGHFGRANEYFVSRGEAPIKW